MDEMLVLLKQMNNRMERMENELMELKGSHKPLTIKDFIKELSKCPGTEFGFWVSKIEITTTHLKRLLTEKKNMIYIEILREHLQKNENNSVRVFTNKNNSIFVFKDNNWKLMSSSEIDEFVKTLYQKVASLNNKSKDDDLGMKQNMLYLDRMKKLMELKKVSPITFKNALYRLLKEHTH
jgi:hypothetical protein